MPEARQYTNYTAGTAWLKNNCVHNSLLALFFRRPRLMLFCGPCILIPTWAIKRVQCAIRFQTTYCVGSIIYRHHGLGADSPRRRYEGCAIHDAEKSHIGVVRCMISTTWLNVIGLLVYSLAGKTLSLLAFEHPGIFGFKSIFRAIGPVASTSSVANLCLHYN